MKKFKNFLGLDLGNSCIKFAYKSNSGKTGREYIPAKFNILAGSIGNANAVTIGEQTIYLGEGIPLTTGDKTKRQYLEHQILFACYKSFGSGAHIVDCTIGLPIKQYKVMKDRFSESLNDIKKITGTVNGEAITINLDKMYVQPEGYASLMAFETRMPEAPVLLIDIGHKTIDIVKVVWNAAEQIFDVNKYDTINEGQRELLELICEQLYGKGVELTPEELEYRLKLNNPTVRMNGEEVSLLPLTSCSYPKCEQLLAQIEMLFGQLTQYDLLFTGGGSTLFLNALPQGRLQHVIECTPEERYYSNALGYLEYAEASAEED